jgi:hypothetical protein
MAEENTLSVEETIRSVIAAAKAGRFSKVANTPEGTNSWTIEAPSGTFMVENINRMSKTAREFNKTNFYKMQDDGTPKAFNLGEWKKKLFYTLLYCLQEGKVFHKIAQDPAKVKSIAKAIKENPANWETTPELIKGKIGDNEIQVVRERKSFASGKTLFRVKLLENGVETLKGSQLMKLWK